MTDRFRNVADHPSAPASRCVAVTPSDSVPLTDIPKALYVGTGGTLVLQPLEGGTVTFKVPNGCLLPVRASFVRATGTTASDIVALL
jgi:hypothetical protein